MTLMPTIMSVVLVTAQGTVPVKDVTYPTWSTCVKEELRFNREVQQHFRPKMVRPVKLKQMASLQQDRLQAYCHAK